MLRKCVALDRSVWMRLFTEIPGAALANEFPSKINFVQISISMLKISFNFQRLVSTQVRHDGLGEECRACVLVLILDQRFDSQPWCSYCGLSGLGINCTLPSLLGGKFNRLSYAFAHMTLHTCKIPSCSSEKSWPLWPEIMNDSAPKIDDKEMVTVANVKSKTYHIIKG